MNNKKVFTPLGASNHTEEDRERNDYYATEPKATKLLLDLETFNKDIWEPACGGGHMASIIQSKGYNVFCSDIIDRGYCDKVINFLRIDNKWNGDIITNPPYKYATEFVYKALELVKNKAKIAIFLRIQFLEGRERRKLFMEYPPIRVWISSSRLLAAKNADFKRYRNSGGSAMAFAWFIWEKGYKGDTIIKWFN